ncbi:hypothetical protein ACWEPN_43910 [Nonomuraea wenchangensis]
MASGEVIFGPALAERVTRYFARLATVRPPREEPFQHSPPANGRPSTSSRPA